MTTAGLGGAIVTDSDTVAHDLKLKRNQGIMGGECITPGRNLIMGEINAAFGCVQLEKLPGFIRERNENMRSLGLYEHPNGYMGTILADDRDSVMKRLNDAGIGAASYYDLPIHRHSYYSSYASAGGTRLPMTNRYADHVLNVPVHPGVTPDALDIIREAVS